MDFGGDFGDFADLGFSLVVILVISVIWDRPYGGPGDFSDSGVILVLIFVISLIWGGLWS